MKKTILYTSMLIAILALSCVHTPSGSPAAGFYRSGMSLFNSGKIEKAAIEFRKANAADPTFAPAYAMLGRVYMEKGDTYRAEMFLRKSIALDDSDPRIYGWLGDIYWKDGKHEKAMEYYERCPEDDPHYAILHFRLGMREFQRGDFNNARVEFQKALKFPDFWGGHYGLGLLACSNGDYETAIENFSKVKSDSADAELNYWLAKSYYHLDKEPQAYLYYKRFCSSADNCDLKDDAEKIAGEIEEKITDPDSGMVDTSMIIPFVLEDLNDVEVGICDLEGQIVKYLFQGSITRGEYTLEWDGTTTEGKPATSGVYLGFVDCDKGLEVYPILLEK